MNEFLISIIIPVYNLEDYIERTLDSVFNQTYKNIEVIAVNDGSKDNSAAILDKYAEKERRLVVFHKKNGGVTSARIKGIELAKGEYIGFVDGDDLIDEDMFERLVNNAVKYNADISHCGYRVIKPNGDIKYCYNTGNIVLQDNAKGLYDLLEGSRIEPGLCNKLFHKTLFHSLLQKETLFDDSLVINEDLLMNYFLFKFSRKSIYEDFCPYQYIKREGSASQSESRLIDYEHPIRVRQIIMKDCIGTPQEELSTKIYISKTLHKLSEISCKDNPIFDDIKKEMFFIIKENKDILKKLSLKQRFNGLMSICFPKLFIWINRFYRNRG